MRAVSETAQLHQTITNCQCDWTYSNSKAPLCQILQVSVLANNSKSLRHLWACIKIRRVNNANVT